MQSKNRIFDDMAKVANTAFSSLTTVKEEIEGKIRKHIEKYLLELDLVEREEFEVVKEMAAKARRENEELRLKLQEIETFMGKKKKK